MKKISIAMLMAACVLAATPVLAQTSTTTATTSPVVSAYLAQLQILRQLQLGMSGEDVATLQAYLATHSDVYPEALVTGYYGPLTAKAVAKLQKKFGLPSVGRVGPMTLVFFNQNIRSQAVAFEHRNGTTTACAKIPPGHFIAPGQLKKRGGVPLPIPTCQILPPGIAFRLGLIGTTTGTSTGTTTPPAIPDPVIASIMATSSATTTATISWTTNVFTTGKVWIGTTSPVTTASSTVYVGTTTNGLSHSLTLTNLTGTTTYYYLITAMNLANITATSSQQSFTTLSQ